MKAVLAGSLFLYAVKSQLKQAECQTFVIDINEEKVKEKLKDLKLKLYQYQTCPFCSKVVSYYYF